MKHLIEFEIPTLPVAKARARGMFAKGRVRFYTPSKTSSFENTARLYAMRSRPDILIVSPLKLVCEFHIPRPKRPKYTFPATRPDIDNYLKAIMDAFNKVIWKDDNCVCEVNMKKVYALNKPKVMIRIESL